MMMPAMTAFRDPVEAPLRKLSVDLIKTYKHINEVRSFHIIQSFTLQFNLPYPSFFSFVLLDHVEMRKTMMIISLCLSTFVLSVTSFRMNRYTSDVIIGCLKFSFPFYLY